MQLKVVSKFMKLHILDYH